MMAFSCEVEDEDVLLIILNARLQFPCMFGQIEFALRALLNGT